jgi:hypothetical protein
MGVTLSPNIIMSRTTVWRAVSRDTKDSAAIAPGAAWLMFQIGGKLLMIPARQLWPRAGLVLRRSLVQVLPATPRDTARAAGYTVTLRTPTLNTQRPAAGVELASSGRTIDKRARARSQTSWKAEQHAAARDTPAPD